MRLTGRRSDGLAQVIVIHDTCFGPHWRLLKRLCGEEVADRPEDRAVRVHQQEMALTGGDQRAGVTHVPG